MWLSSSQCLALLFGRFLVASWSVGLQELGFYRLVGVSGTEGLALSKPLSQLRFPWFSMLKKGWTHTPAFLHVDLLSLGSCLPSQNCRSLCLWAYCPSAKFGQNQPKCWWFLHSDGARVWREGVDAHAITKNDNIDLISFENKGSRVSSHCTFKTYTYSLQIRLSQTAEALAASSNFSLRGQRC